MYTFSSKLKTFSFILMAVGLLGIGYGFLTAPKDIQEVEKLLAAESHGGHGEAKHEATTAAEPSHEAAANHSEAVEEKKTEESHEAVAPTDDTAKVAEVAHAEPVHAEAAVKKEGHDVSEEAEHTEHLNHVLHQLQNKPWSALYVACIFFMLVSLGVLVFYAIQQVAQAGWSPVLFRVMQGITSYLPVGSVIFFVILILCGLHFNHIFIWLDPEVVASDKLIANKSGYLNFPFWIIRAAIFLTGWSLYQYFSRKNCLAQDESNDDSFYKKNFNISAMFLVFFIVSESIMSWDWIMSIDPHWFSTLFGWYVFSSFFVSGVTTIALVTLYLKSRGYLEHVNTSHIHDLAKFMFGLSVFWTYLWFSQFMLIWYANIPEEVTYFITRIELYNLPFFGAVVMNFVFPLLILINTDFKRITWVLVMAGIVILAGHYIDFFNMIMPGTVGDRWFIGVSEIASVLFFLGLFIYVVFTALTKAPLLAKRNPFIGESKHFHY
ncbi:quinol:cytochrome C oxidoreductase [Flavobacterium yafengii]|uniref:quinol:cytochrome C oxidoreductase n=1 Tax=Flavobacterium yafengii TaxID=3041253 RepID=UPI0024A90ED2|nr:quinol:cytochrome C oxidoreductase [Flavobacterium yafengii]MDI5896733.1 quinol:cytochrome C oxidoreductase [Flavobacterium yafengii]MDI6045178.1 quinol:cytochrome C oxidoreductase [Flavobacterium yafengii]